MLVDVRRYLLKDADDAELGSISLYLRLAMTEADDLIRKERQGPRIVAR